MSYFDTLNGFMDNIESTQNSIDNIRQQGFSQGMGELQDKYQMIKQKAMQAIPDTLGDVLDYSAQGVTALSGTYATIKAVKALSKGKKSAKPIEVDEFGLPKLSPEEKAINDRIQNLKNAKNETPAESFTDDPAGDLNRGGSYEMVSRMANDEDIGALQAQPAPITEETQMAGGELYYDTKTGTMKRDGADPDEPLNVGLPEDRFDFEGFKGSDAYEKFADRLARQREPTIGAGENIANIFEEGRRAVAGGAVMQTGDGSQLILADGSQVPNPSFVREAPPTLDPDMQKGLAGLPDVKDLSGSDITPGEAMIARQGQALKNIEKASDASKLGVGTPGGSDLLAKITPKASMVEPEADGVEAVSTLSKLGTAATIAEAPLAAIGTGLGFAKGKGAQTASQVINDGLGAKQGGNLAYRGYNLYKKKRGAKNSPEEQQDDQSADVHSNPQENARPTPEQADPQAPESEIPDYRPLTPLAEEEGGAQAQAEEPSAPKAEPAEPAEPAPAEPAEAPKPSPEEFPSPPGAEGDIADQIAEKTGANALKETTSNLVETGAKTVGKGIGQTIAETLGADSLGDLALGAIPVAGEVIGLGLTLGSIFHDIFGKKKIEQQQEDAENKAQAQEQEAEANLKTSQSAIGTTSGGIDLSSLHNIAGANASLGIV